MTPNLECNLPGCNPVGQSTGFQVSGLCRSGPKRADTRRSGRSELHKTEHEARCRHKYIHTGGSSLVEKFVWKNSNRQTKISEGQKSEMDNLLKALT